MISMSGMEWFRMAILFVLYVMGWLWCLSDLIIHPKKLSYNKIFEKEVSSGRFDKEVYDHTTKNRFQIKSEYGYILSCELLRPKLSDDTGAGNTIAVLCHGLGYTKSSSFKYAPIFLKMGMMVLIYDHRNHGRSGKAYTSMGYYEKYDLRKVINWCYDVFGSDCKIITHGESMGAATVLMHLEIDNRVSCVIADCAYSDLKQLLEHQLKQFYHIPRFLISVESLITFIRAGFWYHQVSPIEAVRRTDTPILFIHGKLDNFVPADMAKQMYTCKKRNKAIFMVAGAKHAESFCANQKDYTRHVQKFVTAFLNKPKI